MSEQTRSESKNTSEAEDQEGKIKIKVVIHGRTAKEVWVKKGSTVQQILDEVKKEIEKEGGATVNLSVWTIRLNGNLITVGKDGKVQEDQNAPVNTNATLVMVQKVVGGIAK